jgi:hypothetical protein
MTMNEITQAPQNLQNALYSLKWEVVWIYEWWKMIITWAADLAIFMWKYSFSWEYREEINEQASLIYEFCKKEWAIWMLNKVWEALQREMKRIEKLPQEQQAKEIWNIAWNVIAMVWAGWLGIKVASKLSKLKKATTLAEKATQFWLRATNVVLDWVGETAISKWLSISHKKIKNILNSVLNNNEKRKQIIAELEEVKKIGAQTPEEKKIQDEFIKIMEEEIKKLDEYRPKQIEWPQKVPYLTHEQPNSETIYVNKEGKAIAWKENIELLDIAKRFEYEVNELWIPKEYFRLVEESWFFKWEKWLNAKYERFKTKNWIDFDVRIREYVQKNPYNIDLLDAYLIYWYTDWSFIVEMNSKLWKWEKLTPNEKMLVERLKQALNKLPDWEWKLKLQYRWDKITFIWKNKWDIIDLDAFISCSNPPTEPYWSRWPYRVTIENAKAKDISSLSLFVNDWDKISIWWQQMAKTAQESVLLPWNKVKIKKIEPTNEFIEINGKKEIIYEILVEQL